ncbi:MAG: sigma 54-interacting transcriptional regulator [Desulfomonile tiedjei]|uniref:Sigma 54-interacting transcriptional regulator n=1 Tax=Desulfomonile tiedjei TaxID=2358 RepID=A0A9D6Z5M4_9BACT|nr:sigma 54-interacting transcriptional regulator [Desulfomonile tiedjei]
MENTQLFQAILNSISEGVMTIDKDWKIVSWNRAAERITGFHREEVLGMECAKVFRAALCRENCPVDRALSCGRPYHDVQVAIHNKRNEMLHLLVNAAPLYDAEGHIIGGLETFRDISHAHWMEEELQRHYGYSHIVGRSEAMKSVFEVLGSLVHTDTTVLIQGESGTGKELIARALHFYGPRKGKSFVAINCSALPEGILESELFGHAKGAFTGAVRSHMGKFELANGGTLFLDEIAEISQAIQVKLLRVLEEREFQRVGDNRNIKVDVRIMTATNKELYKKVLDGSFRDDLYYRLSVFPLTLPPLRERIEDIPLLVAHFIRKFNKQMGKSIQGIADEVLEILESYQWPGNIRELANAIEHAFVHTKGALIHPADLPHSLLNYAPTTLERKSSGTQEKLDSVEREFIVKELEAASWKKSVAARRLGMSRVTLWRKMEKYGIAK